MKKIASCIILFFLTTAAHSQNGLENIIVEKYYVSDANDSLASDGVSINPGTLPVGSVTYRVFVDMLPGYKFQAAYGVPDHEFKIQTSTLFYNNEDRGATSPTYTKTQAEGNTVMLDSWLTVGAACQNNFGVLKTADDGLATVVNDDGVLLNNDPTAGIPISVQDGMIAGMPEPVTIVGITTEIAVFDAQNDGTNGPLFSTWNGSLACLNGAVGPDTIVNQVLIAQITTNGVFSFELNIQIGTPTGGVENYVARNPIGNEILFAPCIYPNTTSIDAVTNHETVLFDVYPNPATDFIMLSIVPQRHNVSNSYEVYDLTGRRVNFKNIGQVTGSYVEPLDLSGLQHGIYFVKVLSDETSSVKKFAIQ